MKGPLVLVFAMSIFSAIQAEVPQLSVYERLTLIAALAIAVVVQYRENRQKEAENRKMAEHLIEAMGVLEKITNAVERLTDKLDESRIR